ncbi:YHS domain-containing protein [Geoalkalibacter ferrihydriticus]|uniref:TRASH domain-containing protein n=2 Tax=Geoalkalibacter ferrihydriticus TaxID=392333 RepID=A0A0C2HSG6_9BACT|nr:YHS domain-containing protein [Geoalkalibacter ferrihydriticus]KIH75687.1 hypothetical protein GFER_15290 [Geoalkalibacter ferrihydriticus DSM 17813]SDM73683.1 YHS domain-containing protein [Geoalkalibacter ferrihydriticus]
MTRLLILTLLICIGYSLWTFVRRSLGGQRPPKEPQVPPRRTSSLRGEDLVQDPQCGTYVPRTEALETQIDGRRHYFCSPRCRDAFREKK